jgi:Tfp pilus assembly protein PilV
VPHVARNEGFSLVESVIACAILATAVLSVGHLASGAVALVTDARSRTFATILAIDKLEELRTSPAPAAGNDVVDSNGQPASSVTSRRYDRRWSVTSVSGDVQILSVVVTSSPGGLSHEVRLTGGWAARR